MEDPHRMLSGSKLPKVILATLVVPFCALLVAAQFAAEPPPSELIANSYSTALALCCWWVAWRLLFSRIFGRRLFFTLTLLVLLRIALNFIHFYFVFTPLGGIGSSAALADADFLGDTAPIFDAAMIFLNKYHEGDVFYAVFGDYYRGINNPGVAILYGWLFAIFGSYATTAIPWAILCSAFASLIVGLTGLSMSLPYRHCRAVVLLASLMPGFFVFPPIYRDNFIIYLLALSGYSAVILRRENILFIVMVVVVESILLYSLRGVYLFLPAAFCVIALTVQLRTRMSLAIRGVALAVLLIPALIVSWGFIEQHTSESLMRFSAPIQGDTTYSILSSFKKQGPLVFFPAAAVFLLLAPMPWWQHIPPMSLSYQIFSYGQTWLSLTVIVALVGLIRKGTISTEGIILTAFFVVLFLLALFGSGNLNAGYLQVGLPFLILASMNYLQACAGRCFAASTAIVVVAHVLLLLKKL
jgi:hypothetical protein